MELTSTFAIGAEQEDGRFSVKETHIASDGQVITYEYLASDEIDPGIVLQARAAVVLAELNRREASLRMVVGAEVPYTKHQFLSRFTQEERIAIRQRAKTDDRVVDFMEMLNASGGVFMSLARQGLLYLSLTGVISGERAAEIGVN